jgi:preprotein translocase subunit SecA
MFNAMLDGIKEESVGYLFNLQVEVQENPIVEEGAAGPSVQQGQPGAAAQPGAAGQPPVGAQPGTAGRAAGQAGTGGLAAGPGAGEARGRHASPEAVPGQGIASGVGQPQRPARLEYSAPTVDGADGAAGVEHHSEAAGAGADFDRVGRNDPCPCGSGRKFKRCHGDPRTRAGA